MRSGGCSGLLGLIREKKRLGTSPEGRGCGMEESAGGCCRHS